MVARESTDPSQYASIIDSFAQSRAPLSSKEWIERASQVKEALAVDAASRDIANKAPRAEIALLKASGLLKVLGPEKYGGGGETWETGYKVIREVAKGDGSLGMLLGYHLLWSTTANVVGTDVQKDQAVSRTFHE